MPLVVHHPLKLIWSPTAAPTARLARELKRWQDTPYRDQEPVPGRAGGVSCFGFVCAMISSLYGYPPETLVGLPRDTGFHNPEGSKQAMRWFLERYNVERVEGNGFQPGDIIVIGYGAEKTPGHLMLAGDRRNCLWHAVEDIGVHFTGMSLPAGSSHHSTYRCKDRDQWLLN